MNVNAIKGVMENKNEVVIIDKKGKDIHHEYLFFERDCFSDGETSDLWFATDYGVLNEKDIDEEWLNDYDWCAVQSDSSQDIIGIDAIEGILLTKFEDAIIGVASKTNITLRMALDKLGDSDGRLVYIV